MTGREGSRKLPSILGGSIQVTPTQKAKTRKTKKPQEPAFEAVIERLEEIVEQLEQGDLPLERSVELFEEGTRLTQAGMGKLDEAERRVSILLEENGKQREEPFDGDGGGED